MILSVLSKIIDFVFVVSLFTLCYFLQRNMNSSKDMKDTVKGFVLLCLGQCLGLAGILAISISAALASGKMPIPQDILNMSGIIPLVVGIISIFALLKTHGFIKAGKDLAIFHTRAWTKVEEFFGNIMAVLKKYIPDPIVLEITIYSFFAGVNTTKSYVDTFSYLNLNAMLLFSGYMFVFVVVKTLIVLIIMQVLHHFICCPR